MKSVQKSLVAFDTDHIKEYVFGTDRLKEIRGASSLLDRLNRQEMKAIADDPSIGADLIYANGGSGLFVVDENKADKFGQLVELLYRRETGGGASITWAKQDLPPGASEDLDEYFLMLMRYKLREKKASPTDVQALPSHPFMRPCDACGIFYAEEQVREEEGGEVAFYCKSCSEKRNEDIKFKGWLDGADAENEQFLWKRILSALKKKGYKFGSKKQVGRPQDFNEFRQFAEGAREYIGLIYADANNMGTKIEQLAYLPDIKKFAQHVDDVIFDAMSLAIKQHLSLVDIVRAGESVTIFPFDILLVGGDDIVMVTSASKAMDVALTLAQQFSILANDQQKFKDNKQILEVMKKDKMSLCVNVVLAPVKYPFGLLQDMAESGLKFAKKAAADERAKADNPAEFDGTRINFQVVTGGSHPDFNETYKEVYHKLDDRDKHRKLEFHASLRPYKPEDLERLLKAIRDGHSINLGRTKLHQLREAVFDKNLTTSVQKGLATLHNWRDKQREHVVGEVYEFGHRYRMPRNDPRDPVSGFPRVTFPWFADGKEKQRDIYRTPLLDFIELYDFIAAREGEE